MFQTGVLVGQASHTFFVAFQIGVAVGQASQICFSILQTGVSPLHPSSFVQTTQFLPSQTGLSAGQ